MKNTVLWRRHIPDSIFEECVWCDDDPELWLSEVEAELDRRFWTRL